MKRYLQNQIEADLHEKMVFLGGPRQVGKTYLAKTFLKSKESYLNWDQLADKKKILHEDFSTLNGVVVLDEVHKYKYWRRLVKGHFDKFFPQLNFLVTGSARLDHFRKGGDSLVGRYHHLRLHPLSLNEVSQNSDEKELNNLLQFGGFPEPFLKANKIFHQRWQMQRIDRVVKQDIRDLESVKDISQIELLISVLESKVSSALSVKSLQEDLEASPTSIEKWIKLLELVFYCYRISPYGPPKIKAVKKAQKLYLWDWSEVVNQGARFENLVASQLLKFCHYQEDVLGLKTELRYFKDIVTEKEIDFIVLQKNKPLFAVECKSGEKNLSTSLVKFGKKLNIPKLYQVHRGKSDFGDELTGRCLPFVKFCKELEMP